MAGRVQALVKPELLIWARQKAGLDLHEAAKKVAIRPERLQSWEAGETRPTVKQLRKLGQVYKRPLAIFYLADPPRDEVSETVHVTVERVNPDAPLQFRLLCSLTADWPDSFQPCSDVLYEALA